MSFTVINPNAIQLDLTQGELIWLLRFLKIPTLPGMLPGLAEQPLTSDAEGGAMIMALQSLQVRNLVKQAGGNQIDIDSGVIGILGSCLRAQSFIFIRRFTEGGVVQTNGYVLPEMSILHEQPQPFSHRFMTTTDKNQIRERIVSALDLPDVPVLPLPEQNVDRETLMLSRTKMLRDNDPEGAAETLTNAGWSREAAEAFLTSVANMQADILVTVVDTREGAPRNRAEFELLISDQAIFYLFGDQTLQVGSTNAPTVMGSLLQAAPTLIN